MPFLYILIILLIAAIIAVPIAKSLGFGTVLGYLAAGLLIGPGVLGLVRDVDQIAHVSELGVVMLLFLIGLELRPKRLWTMRRAVLGMGTVQVAFTMLALTASFLSFRLTLPSALVLGFAMSLSSTAIVLPMLSERDLLPTHAGRDAFSVLLFQDIAVIPAVALIPLLQGMRESLSISSIAISIGQAFAALLVVLIGGRFFVRPIFRLVSRARSPEIFTAATLVIVLGTAALVHLVGLSMSLGAFMAGVLLSDSEYRHELKANIEPFEGLLLGMFFISVGMAANLTLLAAEWPLLLGLVAGLIALKFLICLLIAKLARRGTEDGLRFAAALAQAGEFGFVIFAIALGEQILSGRDAQLAQLTVTLSMIVSPLLFSASERWIIPRLSRTAPKPYDDISTAESDVIICGFGRVGQIVGRILRMKGIAFTALDKSSEQVELVRRFGSQAFYGDPARVDLLRAAGADEAKILVLALEDPSESLNVADIAQRHFPHLTIVARARNRLHVHRLMDRGITKAVRETYYSAVKLTEEVLLEHGVPPDEVQRLITLFQEHDERSLLTQHAVYRDEKQLIQTTKQIAEELQIILEDDRTQKARAARS